FYRYHSHHHHRPFLHHRPRGRPWSHKHHSHPKQSKVAVIKVPYPVFHKVPVMNHVPVPMMVPLKVPLKVNVHIKTSKVPVQHVKSYVYKDDYGENFSDDPPMTSHGQDLGPDSEVHRHPGHVEKEHEVNQEIDLDEMGGGGLGL